MRTRFRTACIRRDKRQVDLGLLRGRELDLRTLRLLQTLQGHLVALGGQVEAALRLELCNQPVHNALVEVIAAQVRITVGRLHLDDALADLKDRDIKGAAAEVIDRDRLVLLLVEAVGQSSRVGSFTIRFTSSPAILPASFVACRCASLKYAGTVMTASVTEWPR